jgi:hypothetical protein
VSKVEDNDCKIHRKGALLIINQVKIPLTEYSMNSKKINNDFGAEGVALYTVFGSERQLLLLPPQTRHIHIWPFGKGL